MIAFAIRANRHPPNRCRAPRPEWGGPSGASSKAATAPRQSYDNILIEKEKRRRRVAPYCGEPKLISAAYVFRWTPDWCHLCSKKHGMVHMKNMSSSSYQIHSFLRKEVIQPQVPLRLPCYDFTPVADPTVVACLPCGLAQRLRVKPTPMV